MKFMIGTAALLLVLTGAPTFAQEEPKPQQQEEHKPQDSPKAPAQEKAPPAKPAAERPKDQPSSTEKPARPAVKAQEKQTEEQTKAQQEQQKKTQQQQQKTQQAQSHSAQAHQNAGDAHRIPDDKFRAHFGTQHHFRPSRGGSRFQYGGYWFAYNDPWPSGWATEDDCYIEDDGGVYYLIDAIHPEFRLLLVVQVS